MFTENNWVGIWCLCARSLLLFLQDSSGCSVVACRETFFFARNDCLVSRSGAVNPKRRNYKKLKATKLEPTNYKPNTHNSVTNRSD